MQPSGKTPVNVEMVTKITQDGEKDEIRLSAKGSLVHKNDWVYVLFTETLEGVGEVNTTLKIGTSEMLILRSGSVSMRQVYIYGQKTEGTYEMPFGKLATEVQTHHLAVLWEDSGRAGRVQFGYDLKLQGEEAGQYHITIAIEEEK